MDLILGGDKFWHLQMVCRFHGNGDIGNLTIDTFFSIGLWFIGINDLPISLIRYKVVVLVLGDEATEAFP